MARPFTVDCHEGNVAAVVVQATSDDETRVDVLFVESSAGRPRCDRSEGRGRVRPFHEGRHTSITSAAATGVGAGALQARAAHSDFATTQRYIDLAGVLFRR